MRLIVHLGFHKTATTFLQHLLNAHHASLARRGIWYQRQKGYPAHHAAALAALRGDGAPLAAMLAEARQAGCHSVIFSSEELETLMIRPAAARLIEAAARASGVNRLEWHIVLREPGTYFASTFAELSHHGYADSLPMLWAAMRFGGIEFPVATAADPAAPPGYASFDHHDHLARFAAATAHPVHAHDYADADPFPGWRMLDGLDIVDRLARRLPEAGARNGRRDDEAVAAAFIDRLIETVPEAEQMPLLEAIGAGLGANIGQVEALAAIIGRRFADSHARALAEFGARAALAAA